MLETTKRYSDMSNSCSLNDLSHYHVALLRKINFKFNGFHVKENVLGALYSMA